MFESASKLKRKTKESGKKKKKKGKFHILPLRFGLIRSKTFQN